MRQRHESQADLAKENAVKEEVQELWGKTLYKLSGPLEHTYKLDWSICDGKIQSAWGECKVRDFYWGQYDTVILSVSKWQMGCMLSLTTDMPFVFVARANNVLAVHEAFGWLKYGYMVTFTGRTVKTRDDGDEEPVIHIPISQFKILKEGALHVR